MKTFECSCGQLLFFENTSCVACGAKLGFLPDVFNVAPLEADPEGGFRSQIPEHGGRRYRLCKNYEVENACNWMVPVEKEAEYCDSCALTEVIPNIAMAENRRHWVVLETAKRRLVYTLLKLRLPVADKEADPEGGLAFEFKADSRLDPEQTDPVLTGHAQGTITINLGEADDVFRETMRQAMHEPYRTLLGHFRHEIGHYYWDRLILKTAWLNPFRQMFGDDTKDYAEALKTHYETGAPANWPDRFISAYASSHAWEDWAESWAHYLHLYDTLETAREFGFIGKRVKLKETRPEASNTSGVFDEMMDAWLDLTIALNSLNRSLGKPDAYPFILAVPVVNKLRFVHQVVNAAPTNAPPPEPVAKSTGAPGLAPMPG
jgi:hypothetical protein